MWRDNKIILILSYLSTLICPVQLREKLIYVPGEPLAIVPYLLFLLSKNIESSPYHHDTGTSPGI